MAIFGILVISDLHLHHGDTEAGSPSYLSSSRLSRRLEIHLLEFQIF